MYEYLYVSNSIHAAVYTIIQQLYEAAFTSENIARGHHHIKT